MAQAKAVISPAYLMYPSDILSSGRVAALEPLEELWYRRALDLGWEHDGMPADAEEFAGWVGRGCTFEAAEKIIAKFYHPHKRKPDKVVNARQEVERKNLLKSRKKKSEGGRKGMENRWKRDKQTTSSDNIVITNPITNDNISIPIPTSSLPTEEFKTSESVGPPPVREIFAGTVEAEISKRLDVKTLPAKLEWHRAADWAHDNGFTADHFLECYDLLKTQRWRDGPVKPKHVTENLPNLGKLRQEIEKQNGANTGNRTAGKSTSVDRLKDQRTFIDQYPTEAELGRHS